MRTCSHWPAPMIAPPFSPCSIAGSNLSSKCRGCPIAAADVALRRAQDVRTSRHWPYSAPVASAQILLLRSMIGRPSHGTVGDAFISGGSEIDQPAAPIQPEPASRPVAKSVYGPREPQDALRPSRQAKRSEYRDKMADEGPRSQLALVGVQALADCGILLVRGQSTCAYEGDPRRSPASSQATLQGSLSPRNSLPGG